MWGLRKLKGGVCSGCLAAGQTVPPIVRQAAIASAGSASANRYGMVMVFDMALACLRLEAIGDRAGDVGGGKVR